MPTEFTPDHPGDVRIIGLVIAFAKTSKVADGTLIHFSSVRAHEEGPGVKVVLWKETDGHAYVVRDFIPWTMLDMQVAYLVYLMSQELRRAHRLEACRDDHEDESLYDAT